MAHARKKVTTVEVAPRAELGKNANRRIRAGGRVPGNVYGLDLPPYSVSVAERRIDEVLHLDTGQNTVLTLALPGQDETRQVMIRELQRDPITDRVIHVDFVRLDLKKVVQVEVPIRLLGTPLGVKNEGGVLDFVHREVRVECLPGAIPEHLDVDVSDLHVNQHVSIEDLALEGEELKILEDPGTILATVSAARVEEVTAAEEAAAEEAAAEAEVAAGEEAAEDADKDKKE